MAANDIFLYTNATSVANAVVTSQTVTTAASFPDLVLGDSPTYNFYFTDGTASWPSFAGNAQYSVEWALGTTSADDSAVLAYQTTATAITGGWSMRLPLNTGAVLNQLNNARVSQEYPVVRVWQQLRVTDPSGYKTTYATIRTNLRLRTAPTDQLLPNDPLPSGYQHVLTDGTGLIASPTTLVSANRLRRNIKIVFEGDSLTSVDNVNQWPAQFESYGEVLGIRNFYNVATSGQQVSTMLATYATQIEPYAPADATETSILSLWGGINDLFQSRTAAAIYADLASIWSAARADGFFVVAYTITPSSYLTAPQEVQRVALNALIRAASASYDRLLEPDVLFPSHTYTNDGTHFSYANGTLIARAFAKVLSGSYLSEHFGNSTGIAPAVRLLGEYQAAQIGYAQRISLASAEMATIVSVDLPVGIWDVSGICGFDMASANTQWYASGISLTDDNLGEDFDYQQTRADVNGFSGAVFLAAPIKRVNATATTTVYLIGRAIFTAGTASGYGRIRATRVG